MAQTQRQFELRRKAERAIAKAVVQAFLDAHFVLSVDNGGNEPGEFEITKSSDKAAILAAMFLTDDEYLMVHDPTTTGSQVIGWVRFVYGNDGWDVISDYDTNMEPYIGEGTEVQRLIDHYSEVL